MHSLKCQPHQFRHLLEPIRVSPYIFYLHKLFYKISINIFLSQNMPLSIHTKVWLPVESVDDALKRLMLDNNLEFALNFANLLNALTPRVEDTRITWHKTIFPTTMNFFSQTIWSSQFKLFTQRICISFKLKFQNCAQHKKIVSRLWLATKSQHTTQLMREIPAYDCFSNERNFLTITQFRIGLITVQLLSWDNNT